MNTLNKFLIIVLGLIIITYVICKFFEEPKVQEGIFPIVAEAVNAARTRPDTQSTMQRLMQFMSSIAFFGADQGTQIAVAGAREGADNVRFGISNMLKTAFHSTDEGTKAAYFGSATGQRIAAKIKAGIDAIQSNIHRTLIATRSEIMNAVNRVLDKIWQSMTVSFFIYLAGFILFILTFFGYIQKVVMWAIGTVSCIINRLKNFKSCFFWYLLEIIGQIAYLPIRLLLWMLSPIVPDIYNYEKQFWDKIYEVDCAVYDSLSFHFAHYPESVHKQCYNCRFKPFPSIVKHFQDVGKQKSAESVVRGIMGL